MPRRILRVALTGGIGTGKSYCLSQFARLGAPTIDADALAREAVAPGSPGFDAVVGRFGTGVLGSDGQLNREELGRLVFTDADARRDLEAIIHPIVYSEIERWFAGLARDADSDPNRGRVAIADIPLLYETGREADFDRVIVAACRPEQQLERLLSRPGISAEDAERRIRSQIPIEDKARRADYVIDTSGPQAETAEQIETLWKDLQTGD